MNKVGIFILLSIYLLVGCGTIEKEENKGTNVDAKQEMEDINTDMARCPKARYF